MIRGRTHDHYWGVVLDAPDARALAEFYMRLLGWTIYKDEPKSVIVAPPNGVAYLAIQTAPKYVRPVWPASEGRQQMMMHLDVEVGDRNRPPENSPVIATGESISSATSLISSSGISNSPTPDCCGRLMV